MDGKGVERNSSVSVRIARKINTLRTCYREDGFIDRVCTGATIQSAGMRKAFERLEEEPDCTCIS